MFFLGVFHGVRKFGFQLGSSSGVGPDRRPWSKPTSKQTRKDRSKPNLRKSVGFRGTAWVFEVFLCFLLCDLIQLFCWEEQVTEQSKKKKKRKTLIAPGLRSPLVPVLAVHPARFLCGECAVISLTNYSDKPCKCPGLRCATLEVEYRRRLQLWTLCSS